MVDGGYPAFGSGEAGESPVPAGYGSLEGGFPPADPEAYERRRAPRDPNAPPRPWARRAARAAAAPQAAPDAPSAPPPTGPPLSTAPPGTPVAGGGPGERGAGGRRVPEDVDVLEGPVHGSRRPRQKVRVVRGVRSKRLVRRVDVWTVCKVSLVFYLLGLVALLVAGVIVWNVASAFNFIHTIEKSVRTLFSLKTFTLHPGATFAYAAGIGVLLCGVGVVVNVLAAVAYNLISDMVGGVQVVVVSEPD